MLLQNESCGFRQRKRCFYRLKAPLLLGKSGTFEMRDINC